MEDATLAFVTLLVVAASAPAAAGVVEDTPRILLADHPALEDPGEDVVLVWRIAPDRSIRIEETRILRSPVGWDGDELVHRCTCRRYRSYVVDDHTAGIYAYRVQIATPDAVLRSNTWVVAHDSPPPV